MYYTIYEMFVNLIYGADVVINGWQEMTATVVATACVLFAFLVPFIVVYKVICIICGR